MHEQSFFFFYKHCLYESQSDLIKATRKHITIRLLEFLEQITWIVGLVNLTLTGKRSKEKQSNILNEFVWMDCWTGTNVFSVCSYLPVSICRLGSWCNGIGTPICTKTLTKSINISLWQVRCKIVEHYRLFSLNRASKKRIELEPLTKKLWMKLYCVSDYQDLQLRFLTRKPVRN